MFGQMVQYWYYTGDTTYNAETMQALQHQVGADDDYMPANQSKSLVSGPSCHVTSPSCMSMADGTA